jgi:putative ABC transport system ATP-binding protein
MLEVKHVSKIYEGKMVYEALNNINLSVENGEFVGKQRDGSLASFFIF